MPNLEVEKKYDVRMIPALCQWELGEVPNLEVEKKYDVRMIRI